jgi:MbtH protein
MTRARISTGKSGEPEETMDNDDSDTQPYLVVLNDEEQYSIWPADRDLPPGWRGDGFSGLKADCLAHIDEVWTDMRPLSLRRAMEEQTARS